MNLFISRMGPRSGLSASTRYKDARFSDNALASSRFKDARSSKSGRKDQPPDGADSVATPASVPLLPGSCCPRAVWNVRLPIVQLSDSCSFSPPGPRYPRNNDGRMEPVDVIVDLLLLI